ncbi:adenylyltransferase/cytidyltransferase family protein [Candidatus Methanarcanum hacksteinii]|uniref:adenylyltransferase/cytidyltransferase family protein n=1 Tax=Candidatus Methanarcanum hacksteinii TaxID=2911857 RepID=UPI0015B22B7C|nr:FAD synthase [Methanomassiliicoccales archaeon]TQS78402.1 MAG: FAD synthase [Candidatus Methanarcanum hacksteinii]
MVRVMASGVFDILHTGHISYLEQAKALGDELYVVVASDNTVRKNKHEPITPERMRVRIVSALKPVDVAMIGNDSGDMFAILDEIRPDVIVLGFDQKFDENTLSEELKKRGFDIAVKRADQSGEDLEATRAIIKKIRERIDLK